MEKLSKDFIEAASNDNTTIVSELIKYVSIDDLRKALGNYMKSVNPRILTILMTHRGVMEKDQSVMDSLNRILDGAISCGFVMTVKILITAGVDTTTLISTINEKNPFIRAIEHSYGMVEAFLTAGANQTFSNCAPLRYAVTHDYAKITDLLLTYINIYENVNSVFNSLTIAINNNCINIVEIFIRHIKNIKSYEGQTISILAEACRYNNLDIVKLLLSSNIIKQVLQGAISQAIEKKNIEIVTELINSPLANLGVIIEPNNLSLLRFVIGAGSIELTEKLINHEDDIIGKKIDVLSEEKPSKNVEQFKRLKNRLRPNVNYITSLEEKVAALEEKCKITTTALEEISKLVSN